MTEEEEISRLLENYEGHKEDPLYRTVMDLVVRANWKKFEEVRAEMCDALVELMEDYVEEQVEERVEQRIKEQVEKRVEQRIKEQVEKRVEQRIKEQKEAGIKSLICSLRNLGIPRKEAVFQLEEQYDLADESAERYVEKYWKE